MIRLFAALTLLLLCISAWRLSDGFTLSKITADLPHNPRYDITPPPLGPIRTILSQPYHYIGKGSQSFVFESEDGNYILKFFRLNRYRLPTLQQKLPLPPFLAHIQNEKQRTKQNKLTRLFTSCTLAYTELKHETALIYIHLNKTTNLTTELTLIDNLHRTHTLDLDTHAFVLQKKGEQVLPHLDRLLKQGRHKEAQSALTSLTNLIQKRIDKGIIDGDAEVHKNAGFYNGEAVFLDIGAFRKGHTPPEMSHLTRKLDTWLEKRAPTLRLDRAPDSFDHTDPLRQA